MKKILRLVFLICISFILSCEGNTINSPNLKHKGKTNIIDTSVIAILSFNRTVVNTFQSGKPTNLTEENILEIENILQECIDNFNKPFKKIVSEEPSTSTYYKKIIIELTNYKRQYIATIDSDGDKIVFINCFCETFGKNWKTELINVRDGGNCFFNLKINLSTGKYYDLMINN